MRSAQDLACLCLLALASGPARVHAQGITTGAIRGTVRASDGSHIDGTRVRARSAATGFTAESEVRDGRFVIQGLEIGGPYTVTAERVGFGTLERGGIVVQLGEPVEVDFVLEPVALPLDTLRVRTTRDVSVSVRGGTGSVLSDSLLRRLPTLNRDLYDFVRLVPQISTRVGFRWGFSGGGVGLRYNNFLINGVPERSLVNATAALSGGKSLPLDAVREYEVLVSPYDVRYGDFAGAMVNAVTRSGTNRLEGSAFAYLRNDRLARRVAGDTTSPYDRLQYGFSAGGPLVRDRLHFFIAAEMQRLSSPAPGPWLGQPAAASQPVPMSADDLARLTGILRGYGLEAGSGGAVENRNPLTNAFGRLDLSIPSWNSRVALWLNYDHGLQDFFSRAALPGDFPLSSMQASQRRAGWLGSVQLHSWLSSARDTHNELLASYRSSTFGWTTSVDQPIVAVNVSNPTGDLTTKVRTGTFAQAQGKAPSTFRSINLVDNLTIPIGEAHLLTAGAAAEFFGNNPGGGVSNSYGTWSFTSLDALAAGIADRYSIGRDFGSASVRRSGRQLGVYVSDEWQVGRSFSVTLGLRGDVLGVRPRAPYNHAVDSIFGRRTDELPRGRVELSPRLGFTWDVFGAGRDRLRGGIGVFTGRPPPLWLYAALANYGVDGELKCGPGANDRGLAPAFEPDRQKAPTACQSGPGLAESPGSDGNVDLLARDLRPARVLRASIAYDRRLPWDLRATGEVLVTRNLSDFEFVNLNLEGPQAVDRHGRVLYGSFVTGDSPTSGIATPALRSAFNEVIELRNTSHNHAWQVSARIEKPFSSGFSLIASYTRSRVRDLETPLRTAVPGTVNWSARAISGRHDDDRAGISLNDVPNRIVLAATLRAPWRGWATEVAFYYVGESGSPFTWVAYGASTRGDLNADGSNVNDPIYVPRSALDTSEIRFTGVSTGSDNSAAAQAERVSRQQEAFERFIERTPCLRRQRGHVMERNSCREPWTNTTVALVRQPIPLGGRTLEAELQLFNLLDLLHTGWGRVRMANPGLLEHVAHTAGTSTTAQPVFRFNTAAAEWTTSETESRFQLQLALRYRF